MLKTVLSVVLSALILGSGASNAVAQPVVRYVLTSTVELSNPHDLKLSPDGQYLFVADSNNNRIAILNPDSLELVDSFGADHQAGTHDIDFDQSGNAYVADTHNNRVLIYQMTGTKASQIGELSELIRGPEGVLVHPNGRIYVAGAWSHNVVAYQYGKVVAELGGLSSPHDLALDPDANIWLADAGNDRLVLLSPELEILRELKGAPYDFDGVRYLDVNPDGLMVVADKNNHQIKVITAEGRLLTALGSGRAGDGSGEFTTPEGVEIDGTTVWLSDSGNNQVVKLQLEP